LQLIDQIIVDDVISYIDKYIGILEMKFGFKCGSWLELFVWTNCVLLFLVALFWFCILSCLYDSPIIIGLFGMTYFSLSTHKNL
jgi:hypothetical protein